MCGQGIKLTGVASSMAIEIPWRPSRIGGTFCCSVILASYEAKPTQVFSLCRTANHGESLTVHNFHDHISAPYDKCYKTFGWVPRKRYSSVAGLFVSDIGDPFPRDGI